MQHESIIKFYFQMFNPMNEIVKNTQTPASEQKAKLLHNNKLDRTTQHNNNKPLNNKTMMLTSSSLTRTTMRMLMKFNLNQTNPLLCLPVWIDLQTMETDQKMTKIWSPTTSRNLESPRMLDLRLSKDQIHDSASLTFYIFLYNQIEFFKLLKKS